MRSSTTSSPAESLGSNLQWATVWLRLDRAGRISVEEVSIIPEIKNVYNELRAVEVIGPVDNGDRMRSKKGSSTSVSGKD